MGLVSRNAKKTLPATSSIDTKVDLTKGDNGLGLAVHFTVKAPGWSKTDTEAIVKEAHAVCPYSKATRNNIEVTFDVLDGK